MDEIKCVKLFGGNFRFMTDINHQLCILVSFLNIISSIYPTKKMNRFASWLQGTIILPNAIIITVVFWSAYAVNPEKTYNTFDHRSVGY